MADLALSIRAEDKASPALREVAKSTETLGKESKETAAEVQKAGTSLTEASKQGASLAGAMLKAQVAFEAVKAAAGLFVDVLRSGYEGMLEAEKADARLSASLEQLGYSSTRLVPALKAQADALEETTLVSAEAIQEVQGLLVRFGTAPRDVQRTTQALLDYAAATGQDVRQATIALSKAVEDGGQGLKSLGIEVEATGDRTVDLGLAVDALSAKFGGSAKTATEGMAGAMGRLKLSQDQLSEAMAGFLTRTGLGEKVVGGLTEAVKGLTTFLAGSELDGMVERSERWIALTNQRADALGKLREAQRGYANAVRLTGEESELARLREGELKTAMRDFADVSSKLKALNKEREEAGRAAAGVADEGLSTQEVERQAREKAEHEKQVAAELARERAEREKAEREKDAREAARAEKERQQAEEKLAQQRAEAARLGARFAVDAALDEYRRGQEEQKALLAQQASALRSEQDAFEAAGAALGSALIHGIAEQVTRTQEGEDFDIGAIIKGIIPVAAAAIGTIYGGPAVGSMAGQAAGLVMNLFHDGGTVRRFHSGGLAPDEVPAVLQTGEVVVSRQDVSRNGGPESVQRMVKGGGGGGGVTIIQAFDARSIQDRFGSDIGAANVRVVQQNRGELAQLLRRRER